MSEPHEHYSEYLRRLAARQQTVAQQTHLHVLYGRARIFTFLVAGLVAWFALRAGLFSAWWLLVPLLVFLGLLIRHEALLRQLERFDGEFGVYEQALRRMEDRWIGTGIRGERFVGAGHPYSGDLDIFGRGSLFELLCTARTQMGEASLAEWLSRPADVGNNSEPTDCRCRTCARGRTFGRRWRQRAKRCVPRFNPRC